MSNAPAPLRRSQSEFQILGSYGFQAREQLGQAADDAGPRSADEDKDDPAEQEQEINTGDIATQLQSGASS